MDGINPDYEVVKILYPDAPITIWEAPGDLFLNRFPIMFGLYSGSYMAYLTLPIYLLFGHTVLSARIAHLLIGVALLICIALLIQTLTSSKTIALVACFLLAIDPAFIYSLRTQAYVIIMPEMFAILAMLVLYSARSYRQTFFSGLLLGLAAYGYFVYFLFLPGICAYTFFQSINKFRNVISLLLGVAVGASPFALGYTRILMALGLQDGIDFLKNTFVGLHVVQTDNSYYTRLGSIVNETRDYISGQWLWQTIWQTQHADFAQSAKLLLLFILPLLALISIRRRSERTRAFTLAASSLASYLFCAIYFGARFGAHDLAASLGVSYVLASVSVAVLLEVFSYELHLSVIVLSCGAGSMGILNTLETVAFLDKLKHDPGAGLYSSIISRLPEEALASDTSKTPYVFWTWGEMMPFIYQTGGTIPAFANDHLSDALCNYGEAKVVFLGDDALTLPETFPTRGITNTENTVMYDPQSNFPYKILTVKRTRDTKACQMPIQPALHAPPTGSEKPTDRGVSTDPALIYPKGLFLGKKAVSVGIYAVAGSGEQCCWISKNVEFRLATLPSQRNVLLRMYVPTISPWSENPGTISSLSGSGAVLGSHTLRPGEQEVLLPIEAVKGQDDRDLIRLSLSQEVNPKAMGLNGDVRDLSAILISVAPR